MGSAAVPTFFFLMNHLQVSARSVLPLLNNFHLLQGKNSSLHVKLYTDPAKHHNTGSPKIEIPAV